MLSNQESLAEKFVKKGFWLYMFAFLMGPIGYIIKVIISRDLSVEEVGMIYGVISFVSFLSMYNDLGCTESTLYFLPKYIVKKEYGKAKYLLRIVLSSQILSSLLIYSIIFYFAPWLSLHYFKIDVTEILRIAGLYFIGTNMMTIATTFLMTVQDIKLQKSSELIRLTGTLIGSSILFFGGNGDTRNYMIIWIFGLLLGIFFSTYSAFRKYYFPYFWNIKVEKDTALRKTFLHYALATLFTANIGVMLSQVDMQLIIFLLGPEDVGFYSVYLSLIGIPFMLIGPIIGFLFPVISELSGKDEGHKIQGLICQFWEYFGIIGIWIGIFFFQFGEYISVFLFGEKFRESGQILAFSSLFMIFNFLIQISFQVLAGTGQVKKRMKVLLITLPINIILNLILIPILGTRGSALAVGLSWIPLYFMSSQITGIKLPIFGTQSLYLNIIGGIIAFLLSYSLDKIFGKLPFFGNILFAIILYVIIFVWLNKRLLIEALRTIKKVRNIKPQSSESTISLPL